LYNFIGVTESYGNVPLNLSANANPCGLIAATLFNDTFSFTVNGDYPEQANMIIDETGIAWPSDIGTKFVDPPNAPSI